MVAGYEVVSQDPHLSTATAKANLPVFIEATRLVERATGYAWRITSYQRASPSHSRGVAMDIAPDIAIRSRKFYAAYNGSDPVLYKREPLIRALQSLVPLPQLRPGVVVGLFIEPDHIHMHLIEGTESFKVIKWGIKKPCYHDTLTRSKLPLLTGKGPGFAKRPL